MSVYLKFLQKMLMKIQSLNLVPHLMSLMGTTIFTANTNSVREKIEYRFNYVGLLFFLLWHSLYFYCSFVSHIEGQTILRLLYDTKLKQYGDSLQDILAFLYILFLMWKLPFGLSKNIGELEEFSNIDKTFHRLFQTVTHFQTSLVGLIVILIQMALSGIKMWALWMILKDLDAPLPWNKMYDVVYIEMLMLTIANHYCFYLMMVKERYKTVNKILRAIKDKNSQEYYIFVRERRARNEEKALQLQEKCVCEKIKTCANIVSTLYESTENSNKKYGVALVFTMFFCLVTITLNLFYLMEATASGLFYDPPRYCAFLVYVFWHIIVGIAVIYAIVCLCELIVAEAKSTGFVVHEIINNNVSTAITSEGARSVVTFLVMLIQFVTDPPSSL
nr:gustatory receptor 47 [Papilio machaon]